MDQKEQLKACIDLIRILPPQKVEENLTAISKLAPDLEDELYQRIDLPLRFHQFLTLILLIEIEMDTIEQKPFIKCEFNRDGDVYRSPWSNQYFPSQSGQIFPSNKLRDLELKAQFLFEEYRRLYYEGGISCSYAWDLDNGFALSFLMKKNIDSKSDVKEGIWESTNVVEVKLNKQTKKTSYKISTTLKIDMSIDTKQLGKIRFAGSVAKNKEKVVDDIVEKDELHLSQIGSLIEDMENRMRQQMYEIYVSKAKEIVGRTRNIDSNDGHNTKQMIIGKIISTVPGQK